jgi:hypothetical protein
MRRFMLGALFAAAAVAAAWPAGPAAHAAASAAGPPKYYVDLENGGEVYVRATATGTVTATLAACGNAVGAAADNTTFYVECPAGGLPGLFSFRLTAAGKITGLAPLPGGQDLGFTPSVIAVSPDGAQVAASGEVSHPFGETPPPRIVVVNTRTGARSAWQGGLNRSGAQLSIASLSWTRNGTLVFLADWCSPLAETLDSCVGTTKGPGAYDAQVRTLSPVGSRGGSLDSGRVLLNQSARYPFLAQALISGDGRTLTIAVMSGPQNPNDLLPSNLSILAVSVSTGRQLAVLFNATVGEAVTISADGSGEYLLVTAGGGRSHGWVHQGTMHPVPPYNGDGQQMAW